MDRLEEIRKRDAKVTLEEPIGARLLACSDRRWLLGEVERLRKALEIEKANRKYLSNGKNEIFELLINVREKFDGTDYQQGKKDGLRSALALLSNPEILSFNRDMPLENPSLRALAEEE